MNRKLWPVLLGVFLASAVGCIGHNQFTDPRIPWIVVATQPTGRLGIPFPRSIAFPKFAAEATVEPPPNERRTVTVSTQVYFPDERSRW